MSNLLDTDAGSELFSSYEAEFKLVQADLSQKLDQITEQSGEPRKSAIRLAERSLEEANELVCTHAEKHPLPVLAISAPISWSKRLNETLYVVARSNAPRKS